MYVHAMSTVHATNLMILRDKEETFASPHFKDRIFTWSHFKVVLSQLHPQEVAEIGEKQK